MDDDEPVRECWLGISKSLDATWTSLLDIGAIVQCFQKRSVHSEVFNDSGDFEEVVASRQLFRDLKDSLSTAQRYAFYWCRVLARSNRDLKEAHAELESELERMPPELASMLSNLRGRQWRPHFRRHYFDQYIEMPRLSLDFSVAFNEDDDLPAPYRKISLGGSISSILERAEQIPPFDHWKLMMQRAQIYAADLHALRSEVGGVMPDGPVAPNRWRHNGTVTEHSMRPTAYRLVRFLWGRENHIATFDECADAVFGEDARTVDKNRIGSHRKSANDFFRDNGIAWVVETKSEQAFLRPTN